MTESSIYKIDKMEEKFVLQKVTGRSGCSPTKLPPVEGDKVEITLKDIFLYKNGVIVARISSLVEVF
ncbi:hypothetical protein KJA15_01445 [Patescibacteria group bacterium]|nr:hypothetical protein [Patescibacteria group bacterium]